MSAVSSLLVRAVSYFNYMLNVFLKSLKTVKTVYLSFFFLFKRSMYPALSLQWYQAVYL